MLRVIPRVGKEPVIDGILDDEVWKDAARITRFLRTMRVMRAIPDTGRAEGMLAYSGSHLYFGFAVYNEDVSALRTRKTQRDEYVWEDDFAGISFLTSTDAQDWYSTTINPIGNWVDGHWGDGVRGRDALIWNGDQTVAANIGQDFWSVEMKLPFSSVGVERIEPGDLWFMGMGHGRTKASSGGSWVQNHGISSPGSKGLVRFGD